MRTAFVKTLVELAERDPRIVLLTGDLGFNALEPFFDRFPNRSYNAGVAEQNMVGMATGLAEAGFRPYVYSIATFATLRPYEFIRNGPIHHHLPVRIVGIGGGFEYDTAGPSHYALEDIGVMRVQPGITVIAPADSAQAETVIRETSDLPGPIYYRIGKNDKAVVRGLNGRFTLGRAEMVRQGHDLLLVAMGSIATEVVAAADLLEAQGIFPSVLVVASVIPPPTADLVAVLSQMPLVLTAETHYVNGGVGSLVAEVIAEERISCRLVRCGVRGGQNGLSGSQSYLYSLHGLSADILARTALDILQITSR
jgi:transketolase